jgi:hypothetical protein
MHWRAAARPPLGKPLSGGGCSSVEGDQGCSKRGDNKGGNAVAIAEEIAVIHDPTSDEAFHVEQHGVDFIPPSERWAKPRDVFGM